MGVTSRVTWLCLQASQNQCQPVSHVTLTARMPEEPKILRKSHCTQNEASVPATQHLNRQGQTSRSQRSEKKNAKLHMNMFARSDGASTTNSFSIHSHNFLWATHRQVPVCVPPQCDAAVTQFYHRHVACPVFHWWSVSPLHHSPLAEGPSVAFLWLGRSLQVYHRQFHVAQQRLFALTLCFLLLCNLPVW